MTSDVATRVARGVTLLDEKNPGWEGQIDLIKLDIGDPELCILGQVYGSFGQGTEAIGIDVWNENGEAEELGFEGYICVAGSREFRDYPELQAEWIRVLKVLRQQRGVEESHPEEVMVAQWHLR